MLAPHCVPTYRFDLIVFVDLYLDSWFLLKAVCRLRFTVHKLQRQYMVSHTPRLENGAASSYGMCCPKITSLALKLPSSAVSTFLEITCKALYRYGLNFVFYSSLLRSAFSVCHRKRFLQHRACLRRDFCTRQPSYKMGRF